jgi:hypothetical protein
VTTFRLTSDKVAIDDPLEAAELYYRRGWTDGLPVVPATEERVQEFLGYLGREPDEMILHETTRRRQVTLEKVVINCVMAGCLPQYVPVVLAALEAMSREEYTLHGSITSTGGAAPLVIVNGPMRRKLDMNSGGNLFGPGNRANATIGRALRLIIMNALGALPGLLDRSTQGHPGKYSFCIAENEEESPWEPLHVEKGFAAESSTVTVFAAEGPHNIQNHYSKDAEGLLLTIADTMACLGSFSDGQSVLVLAPEHLIPLRREGWSKRDVRNFLFAHATRSLAELKRVGKVAGEIEPGDENRRIPRGMSPEDMHIVVGGGSVGGHSAFVPSWSRRRNSLIVTAQIQEVEHG